MEIAQFYLEEAGAKVEKAWNGQEAVALFSQNPAGSFDAILMDVMGSDHCPVELDINL